MVLSGVVYNRFFKSSRLEIGLWCLWYFKIFFQGCHGSAQRYFCVSELGIKSVFFGCLTKVRKKSVFFSRHKTELSKNHTKHPTTLCVKGEWMDLTAVPGWESKKKVVFFVQTCENPTPPVVKKLPLPYLYWAWNLEKDIPIFLM